MFPSDRQTDLSRRTLLRFLLGGTVLISAVPPSQLFGQLDLGEISGKSAGVSKKKRNSKTSGKKTKKKDDGEEESQKSVENAEQDSGESQGDDAPETENEDSGKESVSGKGGPKFSRPVRTKYRIGLSLEARPNGECNDVFGSVPFPAEFPDQKVRVIEDECPEHVKMKYRDLKEGGCRQLLVRMKTLYAGEKADTIVTVEVTRFEVAPPENVSDYTLPSPVPKEIKEYLHESPYIEITHQKIKKVAKELSQEKKDGWDQVDAILKYVRANVKYKDAYKEKEVRGALAALETGEGDCEDMSTLFIALCRLSGIPARTVRVPEHCWAEFYLEDKEKNGYWFPAQVAGNEPLGYSSDTRMILQRGDSFRVPENPKDPSRYVTELFTGKVPAGAPDPIHRFIREEIR